MKSSSAHRFAEAARPQLSLHPTRRRSIWLFDEAAPQRSGYCCRLVDHAEPDVDVVDVRLHGDRAHAELLADLGLGPRPPGRCRELDLSMPEMDGFEAIPLIERDAESAD
jgi:CheY-like chemotaxis protein